MGDYEASQLPFNRIWAKLFMIIFVLSSLLLYNYIISLVFTDIQKIKEESEFRYLKLKIETVLRREKLSQAYFRGHLSTYFDRLIGKFILKSIEYNRFNIDRNLSLQCFLKEKLDSVHTFKISKNVFGKLKDSVKRNVDKRKFENKEAKI